MEQEHELAQRLPSPSFFDESFSNLSASPTDTTGDVHHVSEIPNIRNITFGISCLTNRKISSL